MSNTNPDMPVEWVMSEKEVMQTLKWMYETIVRLDKEVEALQDWVYSDEDY